MGITGLEPSGELCAAEILKPSVCYADWLSFGTLFSFLTNIEWSLSIS